MLSDYLYLRPALCTLESIPVQESKTVFSSTESHAPLQVAMSAAALVWPTACVTCRVLADSDRPVPLPVQGKIHIGENPAAFYKSLVGATEVAAQLEPRSKESQESTWAAAPRSSTAPSITPPQRGIQRKKPRAPHEEQQADVGATPGIGHAVALPSLGGKMILQLLLALAEALLKAYPNCCAGHPAAAGQVRVEGGRPGTGGAGHHLTAASLAQPGQDGHRVGRQEGPCSQQHR